MPVLLYPPEQRVAAALAHSLCDALVAARQATSRPLKWTTLVATPKICPSVAFALTL